MILSNYQKWSKRLEKCLDIRQLAQTVIVGYCSRSQLNDFVANCNSKLPQEMWIWKAWQKRRPNLYVKAKLYQISGIVLNCSISSALAIKILQFCTDSLRYLCTQSTRYFFPKQETVRLGMITSVNFLESTWYILRDFSFDIVWLTLTNDKSA